MNRRELAKTLSALLVGAASGGRLFAQPSPTTVPMKATARKRGMSVGVAMNFEQLNDAALTQFIVENFELITPANEMKWNSLRPAQAVYDFTHADQIVSFAESHNMLINGHNLCWNILNPGWVNTAVNKQNARGLLEEHIKLVAGRYQGRIHSWDVVNEPIRINAKRPDGLSTGPWLDNLGPEYIDIAFHAAQAADPAAIRVLNLDNAEQDTPNGEAVRKNSMQLIRDLVKRGVPLQAVALQSHLEANLPIHNNERTAFVKEIKSLGLEVFISEVDVDDTRITGPDDARRAQVASCYHDYLQDMIQTVHPRQVVFWSLSDKGNWYDWGAKRAAYLRRDDGAGHFPGLLTADGQPTPALAAVESALN